MTQSDAIPTAAEAAPATMKAVVQAAYGPEPESVLRLGRAPVPAPGAGEVLIRVAAVSVDRATWHLMTGLPYPLRLAGFGVRRPRFGNPGLSLAGTVAAVGEGVDGLEAGDEVFGVGKAALAEFAIAKASKLARKPSQNSFTEAAAVPIAGLTALQAVRDHGRVATGDRVLVYGASGGVGSFAVQLAVAAGAHVTAVCSAAKAERISVLGADEVVAYESGEPAGAFDVILDTGGNRSLRVLRRLLTADGRLVIIGGENGGRWLGGTGRQLRAQAISPFVRQRLGTFLASENAGDLRVLAGRLASGALRPLVDGVHPLADTAAAVRRLVDGRAVGKVVVAVE